MSNEMREAIEKEKNRIINTIKQVKKDFDLVKNSNEKASDKISYEYRISYKNFYNGLIEKYSNELELIRETFSEELIKDLQYCLDYLDINQDKTVKPEIAWSIFYTATYITRLKKLEIDEKNYLQQIKSLKKAEKSLEKFSISGLDLEIPTRNINGIIKHFIYQQTILLDNNDFTFINDVINLITGRQRLPKNQIEYNKYWHKILFNTDELNW